MTGFDDHLLAQPSLGEQMRAARRSAGLSIAETARRAGTSRAAIHSYECGQVSPTLVTAARILSVYGCSLQVAAGR
jgi:transcriptional regulator with XRE-family HTH domain